VAAVAAAAAPACIITNVNCLPDDFFEMTPEQVVARVKSWDWKQVYAYIPKIFAPKKQVERAVQIWRSDVLGIKEDSAVSKMKCACKKRPGEGTYFASFPESANCAQNPVPACKELTIECV